MRRKKPVELLFGSIEEYHRRYVDARKYLTIFKQEISDLNSRIDYLKQLSDFSNSLPIEEKIEFIKNLEPYKIRIYEKTDKGWVAHRNRKNKFKYEKVEKAEKTSR